MRGGVHNLHYGGVLNYVNTRGLSLGRVWRWPDRRQLFHDTPHHDTISRIQSLRMLFEPLFHLTEHRFRGDDQSDRLAGVVCAAGRKGKCHVLCFT